MQQNSWGGMLTTHNRDGGFQRTSGSNRWLARSNAVLVVAAQQLDESRRFRSDATRCALRTVRQCQARDQAQCDPLIDSEFKPCATTQLLFQNNFRVTLTGSKIIRSSVRAVGLWQ